MAAMADEPTLTATLTPGHRPLRPAGFPTFSILSSWHPRLRLGRWHSDGLRRTGKMKRQTILLMLLLAGCANYVPKPLDPAVQESAFESRRLDGAHVRQFIERSLG